jgi:tRNA threonylcarbamoyladenosine biosynthesis protein TsaE
MTQKFISRSAQDTKDFAEKIASNLKGKEVVLLYGDLGSGKTTFTQGLAKALGITKKIISPTFIIMRTYELPEQIGDAKYFYHVDLYRTQSEHDIEGLGLKELLGKNENIVVIEWPEKISTPIENSIKLYFKYLGEEERQIVLEQ